jgi:hypothetical protein
VAHEMILDDPQDDLRWAHINIGQILTLNCISNTFSNLLFGDKRHFWAKVSVWCW